MSTNARLFHLARKFSFGQLVPSMTLPAPAESTAQSLLLHARNGGEMPTAETGRERHCASPVHWLVLLLRRARAGIALLLFILSMGVSHAAAPIVTVTNAITIPEDQSTNLTIMVTDADSPVYSVTMTARSSNTNLLPQSGLAFSGAGTNRILVINPYVRHYGSSTITLVATDSNSETTTNTITLTVVHVNLAPSIAGLTAKTMLEDATTNLTATFRIADVDSTNFTTSASSSNTNLVTVAVSGSGTNRTLTFSPVTNANGSTTITVTVDDGALTNTGTTTVTITPVNDVPSFTLSTNLLVATEDAGAQTNAAFLTSLSAGPTNETNQTWTFTVTSGTNFAYAVAPAIGTNGALTFTTKANVTGTNTIKVVMKDSGGTLNGGLNSYTNTFQLAITPANDAPVITNLLAKTILEDVTTNLTTTFKIADVDSTNFTASASSSNTNLATVAISGSGTNRTLTFSPATNANGSATITVTVDDGTLTNTGTMTLTVTPVNDLPGFTLSTNLLLVAEDAGAQTNAAFLTSLSAGPTNETNQTWTFTVTSGTNFAYAVAPAISTNGTLTFTTKANATGTNTVKVVMKDSGGTLNGGRNSYTNTFQLAVNPANDAPVITNLLAKTILEDGATNLTTTFKIADVDSTNFTASASSSNTNLVTVAVSGSGTNRTLTFSPATNAYGSATITVTVDDGTLTNTGTMTLTVTPVNDAPSFNLGANNFYLRSTNGEPWGELANSNVMNRAFGTNGWRTLYFETADTNELFQTGTAFLFIEGSEQGALAMGAFLTNYHAALEDWVNAGGAVFINAAPTVGTNQSLGFGVTLNYDDYANDGAAAAPAHAIFQGPFTPTGTSWSGTRFGHASVSGVGLTTLITNSVNGTALLAEKVHGSGIALFGGMTTTNFHTPLVEAGNFRANILTYTAGRSTRGGTGSSMFVAEDAGPQTNRLFLTNIKAGPANETNQTWAFTVTSSTNVGFAVPPAISTNGTLTFATKANAVGTNTIKVVMKDSGGTLNGGRNSYTNTFQLTVTPANDAPVVTNLLAKTILEDVATNLTTTFKITDVDSTNFTATASSSNTNLVTVAISGSGTNRTLTFSPATNANGSATITVTVDDGARTNTGTTTVTVTPVNDLPGFTLSTNLLVVGEDAGAQTNAAFLTSLSAGPANETNQTWTFTVTSGTNFAYAVAPAISTNGMLTFTTKANAAGTNTIKVVMKDSGGKLNGGFDSYTNTFQLAVTPVNDAPVITNLLAKTILEDVATNLTTTFKIADVDSTNFTASASSSNTNLATVAISGSGPNRTLTFSPATNAYGTATITVTVDDGTLTNSGAMILTLTPVNDLPGFTLSTNLLLVAEDAGAQTNAAFLTSLSAGPANETNQTWTFTVTGGTNFAYAVAPAIGTNGTLTFTTKTNAYGTNTIKVVMKDNGGTLNGGRDSVTNTFQLAVTPVNDVPVITNLLAKTIIEDTTTNKTATFRIADVDSTNFTASASSSDTNFVTVAISGSGTNRTLTFSPATNANGSATITVTVDDGALTNTGTMTLTVTPVNDLPGFTLSTNLLLVAEDAGAQTNAAFLTSLSAGPTNETNQTWTFTVTSGTNFAYAVAPAISTNGTLTFTTKTNATGTNTIKVVLKDNGGTLNGGRDSVTNTFQLAVTPVNDAPAVTNLLAKTILEDVTTNLTTTFKIADVDSSSFTASSVSSDTNLVTVAISGSGTNRTLTFSPATNANGSATITVTVDDGTLTNTGSMTLTVTPVNDLPGFSLSTNLLLVAEDAGAQTNAAFLTSLSAGPTNETNQTWTFTVTSGTNFAYAVAPAISTNGTLTFTTKTNAYGTNSIKVVMKDSGGTLNGGRDSVTNTFQLAVTPANDAPVVTNLLAKTILEDATNNLTTTFQIADVDSTNFTASASCSDTNLVTVAISGSGTNRTLTFSPATNAYGSATITVTVDDGALTNTGTMTLTVTPVNDVPSFSLALSSVTVDKFTSLVSITNAATNIVAGQYETNQSVSFVLSNSNPSLFLTAPAISTNGTLTFTPNAIAGQATVTVIAEDNGGTANSGVDTSGSQTFTIVVPANPFITLQGAYAGLFFNTNAVSADSAGYFRLVLETNGAFSGYLLGSADSNQFTGQFSISNAAASVTVTNAGCAMSLGLDTSLAWTESITGTITNSTDQWGARLAAYLAVYSPTITTPLAGEYNLVLPGSTNAASAPGGDSFFSLLVRTNGVVALDGWLSDDTEASQTTHLSRYGHIPFYVPLTATNTFIGAVYGWLTLNASSGNSLSSDSVVAWAKGTGGTNYYVSGFTNTTAALGSEYDLAATDLLAITNGLAVLTGGNLAAPITNAVTIANNIITVDPSATNQLSLAFSRDSGQIYGTVAAGGRTNTISGVILQRPNSARGYFMGGSQSGSFRLIGN